MDDATAQSAPQSTVIDSRRDADPPTPGRGTQLRRTWHKTLDPGAQSAVLSWAAFTTTFGAVRALTHWIRAGHGPAGGGMSVGGQHFHHYNIGIALLGAVGATAIRGSERHHKHPATALSYGLGTALIVDELALLLDLEDVYWAKQGRTSVDAAVMIIGLGGLGITGYAFWPEARKVIT
ncbi:hypothetical protein [Williamsia sterculiae]|uniref:Integral membrane protein n=1 Tax=Williamsia sterculiae TaxID=1344003 RepID=A0A1N7DK28_9NOCA|nr:hypothetical protein [Williamsia sterculiae]SIR76192.1 hypothetical protein SAMN05445060_0700 [Williamsia sterculiae]